MAVGASPTPAMETREIPNEAPPAESAAQDPEALTRAAGSAKQGVQAILLPNWSSNSVENFLDVFRSSRGAACTKGPQGIEIAFLAWQDHRPSRGYWKNADTIIGKLLEGGHQVFVTVHLSLHAVGSGFDGQIKANAKEFNDNLVAKYAGRVTFNVCPSLEDYTTSAAEYQRWTNLVASQIASQNIGKVNLRRSGISSHTSPSRGAFHAVQQEYHGGFVGSGDAYSNDGNLVYYTPNREDSGSLDGGSTPTYSLDTFKANAGNHSYTTLLWRPAYNLLRQYNSGSTVHFTKDGRNFNDGGSSFNSTEVTVLKKFLGIS